MDGSLLSEIYTPMNPIDELNHILDNHLLEIYFQPIVDGYDGTIRAYEALMRGPWNSPLHAPLTLFQVARECGKLVQLDQTAREIAIRQFASLKLDACLFLNVTPSALMEEHYRRGLTLAYLKKYGLEPAKLVIEITEHDRLEEVDAFVEAMHYYRNMGFQVAMDDLGSGSSTLKLWSELKPDFVKLDKHFVQGIDKDHAKRQFVCMMAELARKLHCKVVVEGVERREELDILCKIGLPLMQGYLFARPEKTPCLKIPSGLFNQDNHTLQKINNTNVYSLAKTSPIITSDTRVEQVNELFLHNDSYTFLPVVDNGEVKGAVSRIDMLNLMATRFGRELHGRKPISELMEKHPLQVDANMPLEKLSRLLTDIHQDQGNENFIITHNNQYLGVGNILDLLREVTNIQIQYARYANPLTLLPGNVPIDEAIKRLLSLQRDFIVAYIDIDHFKAFNDGYGYKLGDDVIVALANILRQQERDGEFIGHIGGDDFILLLNSQDWYSQCEDICARFNDICQSLYKPEDLQRGGIEAIDRQGQLRLHPLMSLSIAAVPACAERFSSTAEIAGVASEVKKQAKAIPGNSIFIDRRGNCHNLSASLPSLTRPDPAGSRVSSGLS